MNWVIIEIPIKKEVEVEWLMPKTIRARSPYRRRFYPS